MILFKIIEMRSQRKATEDFEFDLFLNIVVKIFIFVKYKGFYSQTILKLLNIG